MKKYKFEQTVKTQVPALGRDAEGREVPTVKTQVFPAGTEIGERDVLPGCLESMLRLNQVREVIEADAGTVFASVMTAPPTADPRDEEIVRLRKLLDERDRDDEIGPPNTDPALESRKTAADEIARLRAKVAELEAVKPAPTPAPVPAPEPAPAPTEDGEKKAAPKGGKK